MSDQTHPHHLFAKRLGVFASCLLLIAFALVVRFYGLSEQGFHDGDEWAKYLFFIDQWQRRELSGVAGSLWARPSSYLFNIYLGELFGFSSSLFNLKTGLFGIACVALTFLLGCKFFNVRAALVSTALVCSSMTMIYWSRTAKEIITSTFVLMVALYFLMNIIKSYNNSSRISYRDPVLFGFFIGLAFTFHPNLAVTVVACGSVFAVYLIKFALVEPKQAFKVGLATFISTISLIVAYEILFLYLKYSASWGGAKDIGYIKYLLYHSDISPDQPPTFLFYLGLLDVEGPIASVLISISLVYAFFSRNLDRIFILPLGVIIVLVSGVYTNSELYPAFRNLAHLLIPAYLIAGAFVSAWLSSLKIGAAGKNLIVGVLIFVVLMQSALKSSVYYEYWSDGEQLHKVAGGGDTTAIYKPAKSIYHWYQYYFPNNLFTNWDELWSLYLCGGVDYLVVPAAQTDAQQWFGSMISDADFIYGADDTYLPYKSYFFKLDDHFARFKSEHNHYLKHESVISFTEQKSNTIAQSQEFRSYISSVDIDHSARWFTVSGNFLKADGIEKEDLVLVGLGTVDAPFSYFAEVIEKNALSGNSRSQFFADNKYGHFKFGVPVPRLNEKEQIIVSIYIKQADGSKKSMKIPQVKVRSYSHLEDEANSCNYARVSLKKQAMLANIISGADQENIYEKWSLAAGANGFASEFLQPGGSYRLGLNYDLGEQTVGRVSIVNKKRLISRTLYFAPSKKRQFVEFTLPYDLSETVHVYLSAAKGKDIDYQDVVLEKISE